MRWPWVSRARYDVNVESLKMISEDRNRLLAQLDAAADRFQGIIDTNNALIEKFSDLAKQVTAKPAVPVLNKREPDPVADAIRQVAGNDRNLLKLQATWVAQQRRENPSISTDDLVEAILRGNDQHSMAE